jgi:oxygen-independent coproporphyrinogen-3 oxidase
MIKVKLNREDFEYDIHSLIKAFYPEHDVIVTAEDGPCDGRVDFHFDIDYIDEGEADKGHIDIALYEHSYEEHGKPGYDAVECRTQADGAQEQELRRLSDVTFAVDFSDRFATKNLLKQNLYRIISESTGKTLPWGTLTGIRPTKIAMKMLENDATETEIARHMRDTYYTSEEKIELSLYIAERELKLINAIDSREGFSLYVGIPFCPTTCLYCSFTSYPIASWSSRVDEYLDALDREIDYIAEEFAGRELNSVYIGGGTPTTLQPHQLDRLIEKVKSCFDLSYCLEFTVEAGRPDSITREKLQVLRDGGVSRISINPQTMNDETLKLIGRHHTVAQTVESFKLARELGFDNINMDLIMGLPGETIEDVHSTMEQVIALSPDNITVHSLALKRAARLNIEKDIYSGYTMVNTQEHMDLAASYAAEIGLTPYYMYRQKSMAGNLENVGYARPGADGVYNIIMIEETTSVAACGAGTITKRVYPDGSIARCENVKDVEQYITRIDEMIERKRRLFAP